MFISAVLEVFFVVVLKYSRYKDAQWGFCTKIFNCDLETTGVKGKMDDDKVCLERAQKKKNQPQGGLCSAVSS